MGKWKDEYYLEVFDLAIKGKTDREIAKSIGVKPALFDIWLEENDVLCEWIKRGRIRSIKHNLNPIRSGQQRLFLTALAETGSIPRAAKIAEVRREYHWRWLKEDDEMVKNGEEGTGYREAYEAAMEWATDTLEMEARRRAVQGVRKMKFYKGIPVMIPCDKDDPDAQESKEEPGVFFKPYYEHEYSDGLLIKLLEAKKPGEYRNERNQTQVNVGTTVVLQDLVDEVESTKTQIIDADYIRRSAEALIEGNMNEDAEDVAKPSGTGTEESQVKVEKERKGRSRKHRNRRA